MVVVERTRLGPEHGAGAGPLSASQSTGRNRRLVPDLALMASRIGRSKRHTWPTAL